ncbi:hypothetical protein B0H66DRAFT_561664 [Apodospora peruviana]|uniref:PNPLA domain-containing protein n=1 Tax=Apodospora peruviana TaxID=516989 RepID=A0AAE0M2F9_9PEZI|nr:hypothetical protein B0H66DRAFT_561664 [Apodospora peruviana]
MADNPLLADFFDLISGTSTGGLIALLLGRVGLSIPEAQKEYVRIAKEIFSVKTYLKDNNRSLNAALGTARKECLIIQNPPAKRIGRLTKSPIRSFICVVPQQDVRARNEACCTISAAPTYFDLIDIGDEGDSRRLEEVRLGFPRRRIACVVSIGTGLARVKFPSSSKTSPLKLVEALKKMATESDTIAEKVQKRFRNIKDMYLLFSVDCGLDNIELEEWENLGEVRTYTTGYLEQDTVSSCIDTVVMATTQLPRKCRQQNTFCKVRVTAPTLHG